MSGNEKPQSTPENPYFTFANRMIAKYIGALEIAGVMQKRANIDPLTRIPNRYALEESYAGLQNSERKRAGDAEQPTATEHSLLMVDIDHFKSVNDKQGHDKGDRILSKIAVLLDENTRKRDVAARLEAGSDTGETDELAARIGGEEFAILLPRANPEQAVMVAEKLRGLAEEEGDVTLSIGVAGIDLNKSLEGNLINADLALYDAKEQGRNQVVRYDEFVERQLSTEQPVDRRA